jgi:putative ABC transport system permease protein
MPLAAVFTRFSQDLSYGLRVLRRNPGFSAATVLTLALGIGANTAMFSVADAVLLRSLPYKDQDRLVAVPDQEPHRQRRGYSAASLLDRREQNRVFENLAGWANSAFNVSGQDLPERVNGMAVSWDFFKALGVPPALGRTFAGGDDRLGAPRVAVLSHALWQRKFGGDTRFIGRLVSVNGQECTIVEVMPRRLRFPTCGCRSRSIVPPPTRISPICPPWPG